MTKVRDYLGPYRLVRLIRLGGTCQVWEGVNEATNDRYALKVLRPDFRGNRHEIAQLKHEWNVASQLKHPKIIHFVEFNTDADTPFSVLELFSELNLKQMLRLGPDAIAFHVQNGIDQMAEALHYMHGKGWIHCDLKPDNLLMSRNGQMRLIDFTIAQRKGKENFFKRLFGIRGTIRGTRSYMSPEQIRGQGLDERADLYSFACVLFELCCGKAAYTGSSPNELLNKHLNGQIPSILVFNQNITPEFAALVKKMMAKNRDDRPGSMWEFLKQFRQIKMFKKAPRIPSETLFDEIPNPSADLMK